MLLIQMSVDAHGLNENIIMSSFMSSRNIQKKECGPDRSVSDNESSSFKFIFSLAVYFYDIGKKGRDFGFD